MIMLLKVVLFAILKEVMMIFMIKIKNVKNVNTVVQKISKRYYIKEDNILQNCRDNIARFTDLVNILKALEEQFLMNDSEIK